LVSFFLLGLLFFFFSSLDYSPFYFFTLGGRLSFFFLFSFPMGVRDSFFFLLRPAFFLFFGRRFFFGALGYRRPLFFKKKQPNKPNKPNKPMN
jgi:hypothetical protein